jgi:hypothetical protein
MKKQRREKKIKIYVEMEKKAERWRGKVKIWER